jgi:hypothetical protein
MSSAALPAPATMTEGPDTVMRDEVRTAGAHRRDGVAARADPL